MGGAAADAVVGGGPVGWGPGSFGKLVSFLVVGMGSREEVDYRTPPNKGRCDVGAIVCSVYSDDGCWRTVCCLKNLVVVACGGGVGVGMASLQIGIEIYKGRYKSIELLFFIRYRRHYMLPHLNQSPHLKYTSSQLLNSH